MERKRKQGWSSEEIRDAWQYRVDRDFSPIGDSAKAAQPFQAPVEYISYDSAKLSIPFHDIVLQPYRGIEAALDPTGEWLAVASGTDILIYSMTEPKRGPITLRGHTNIVDGLVFAPGGQGILVSSGDVYHRSEDDDQKPEIILWNIAEQQVSGQAVFEAKPIAEIALQAVDERLVATSAPFSLTSEERGELLKAVERIVSHSQRRHAVPTSGRLTGMLSTSFGSEVFSHGGDILVYIPGKRPRSNGDDDWSLKLRWLADGRELLLKGHRDAIMWTSFSPDDSLLASVAWDGTFRIWQVETGEEVHKWESGKQNWAGCFSPDGLQFLGTDGDGWIKVWDLESGNEVWRSKAESDESGRWRRHVAWSVDGRYVAVGGRGLGLISLFDTHSEVVEGVLRPFQSRRLSAEGFDFTKHNLHPDDEKSARSMAGGFLEVQSLQFLQGAGKGAVEQKTLWLGHKTSTDRALELVDLYSGKKRRYISAQPSDEEAGQMLSNDRVGKNAGVYHPSTWLYVSGINQLVIVNSEGARFWTL